MDVYGGSEKEMIAKDFLYKNLKAENKEYFGSNDEKWLSHVCYAWMNDESNSSLSLLRSSSISGLTYFNY